MYKAAWFIPIVYSYHSGRNISDFESSRLFKGGWEWGGYDATGQLNYAFNFWATMWNCVWTRLYKIQWAIPRCHFQLDIFIHYLDDGENYAILRYKIIWIIIDLNCSISFKLGQTINDATHCTQLYCWDDVAFILKTQPGAGALFGTTCGIGKICSKGECKEPDVNGGNTTEKPTDTVAGVIQSICDAVNNLITSIVNIFG